jgi:tRNA pseudouridine38/39 synthase
MGDHSVFQPNVYASVTGEQLRQRKFLSFQPRSACRVVCTVSVRMLLAHCQRIRLLPLTTVARFHSNLLIMSNHKYKDWSHEQLVERILSLEQANTTSKATEANTPDQGNAGLSKRKSLKKPQRPFDMSKYSQRPVAFKVAYFGWPYSGFAAQGNEKDVPTVEGAIFKALMTAKLIEDPEKCNYSRCGRTDKGVSGLGQVIGLNVRSNKPKGIDTTEFQEIPYIDTLNRILPKDIRIIAWSGAPENFNARFDCVSRTYKYFFVKGRLDLDRMRKAASYLIGSHDFRNFCKLDPSKNIQNYERTVLSVDIRAVEDIRLPESMQMYELELKGTAFLWHQVRCMMSVLFLAGQGLENPEVVRDLVDVEKIPSRPEYIMANDLPLVLYDCEFKGLDWQYASDGHTTAGVASPFKLWKHLHEQWYEYMTKSMMFQTLLRDVDTFPFGNSTVGVLRTTGQADSQFPAADVVLGGGREHKMANYVNILDMQRCDSDEVKKEKYRAKKQKTTK